MNIKITQGNSGKIEAALSAVNGKAGAHTFTTFDEVKYIASLAENRVVALVGTKKHAKGATAVAVSGDAVSNSYNRKGYVRAATKVRLERRATGWFLTEAARVKIGQSGGVFGIRLTAEQDALAVAKLRQSYGVIRAARVVG